MLTNQTIHWQTNISAAVYLSVTIMADMVVQNFQILKSDIVDNMDGMKNTIQG